MEGLALLAGLLGGYAQGRQLKQNRSIRQATLKAQQDDRNRQYELDQQKFAYQKLKDANKPDPNIDTGPSLIFDRQIDPLRQWWKGWNDSLGKETTFSGRKRLIDEGLAKMPYHRQLVKTALDTYGPQIGYKDVDPDLFLGGMHGMAGVNYDSAKGVYTTPEGFYKRYAPPVSAADKARVRQELDNISQRPDMPIIEQQAKMKAIRDSLADIYGQDAALAEIPYLPGETVPLGTKVLDVDGTPQAYGDRPLPTFDDKTNPFVGTKVDGGIARRTVPQQNLLGMFGTDAPGMFAPQAQQDAYQDARYKPFTDANPALQPKAQLFNPSQGRFNVAPMFQPQLNQPEFSDPDKEFRRGFATRVMSGSPKTEEEAGLAQFVQSQRQYNPNFDPFRNADDLRFTLQMASPQLAPTLHRSAAKMATGEGSSMEFVPQTQKSVPVTGKYTIAPKASAISALASADYTNEKKRTEVLMREPNFRLAVAREQQIREGMANDKWRQQFDAFKFSDESKRGWAQLGISQDRLSFDISKDKFDRWKTTHKMTQDDVAFVQSLTKHQDQQVKTLTAELNSVGQEISRMSASQWINHTSLNSVDDAVLAKVKAGQEPSLDEWNNLTTEQKMAVNEQINMFRLSSRAAALRAQLTTADGNLTKAREWEAGVRAEFSGQAKEKKDITAKWKAYNPKMDPGLIAANAENGIYPPDKTGKPQAKPKTVNIFGGK